METQNQTPQPNRQEVPHEKVVTFKRKPLFQLIYETDSNGVPISYCKMSAKSYQKLRTAIQVLQDNFRKHPEESFTINGLAKKMQMNESMLSRLLHTCAGAKIAWRNPRTLDREILLPQMPFLIQQKLKFIKPSHWGMMPPVKIILRSQLELFESRKKEDESNIF